ncbi:MAG TPA: acyl-CoA dehydrogenase family protein [Streptosporangiaceae bacterium]
MDFARGEAEIEVSGLAARVLAADDGAAPAGSSLTDAGPTDASTAADLDSFLWKELAHAGLLSLALPPDLGGDDLGMLAIGALLTEVGRRAARIPALATLALGVLPVVKSADPGLRAEVLTGVAGGDTILTAALREPSSPMPDEPGAVTTVLGLGGTVSGVKIGVPYAAAARWILVPTSLAGEGRTVIAVVEPDADGLSCQRTRSSSGLPEYTLRLDRTPVAGILEGCTVGDLCQFAIAGACAVADGALAAALDLTTTHLRTREQFGRPLATFQAAAQQIADVYATARTLHLVATSACWRLDTGRDAARDADIAAYWLAQYVPAAMRSCHHLHGGVGMDVTYPLPRYSALVTDLAALVGGAEARLDRLAAREAAEAVEAADA